MKERSLLYGSNDSWRHWIFCSITKSWNKGRKNKLLGMQKSWLSLRSFWENILFLIKTFSLGHFSIPRMWDAEFSLSTKQNRRSHKALFARCRLEVPVRHNLTQSVHRALPTRDHIATIPADQKGTHLTKCGEYGEKINNIHPPQQRKF